MARVEAKLIHDQNPDCGMGATEIMEILIQFAVDQRLAVDTAI